MSDSFSYNQDGNHYLREHSLTDLLGKMTFVQALVYAWTGHVPTADQEAMLNACLVAVIDHGAETLSAQAARTAASGGAEMHAAVAAGLLAAGRHHGSTVLGEASALLRAAVIHKTPAKKIVAEALAAGRRLPGYGHRIYTTDHRTAALLAKATELHFVDAHVRLAFAIEKELETQKGKKLCLNVDGMIAALLPGLGIAADVAPGVFLVARTAGLVKHVAEEYSEKPAHQRKGK
jgi:citrate synthase